jgi:hypothetical protein
MIQIDLISSFFMLATFSTVAYYFTMAKNKKTSLQRGKQNAPQPTAATPCRHVENCSFGEFFLR